jgi:Ca2+-binding EF-hand superfamily protein
MQRRCDVLKRDLSVRFDYTPLAAYRSIDRYATGQIDSLNLGSFLRAQNHSSSEHELVSIIRRIDVDGDAALSFSEFGEYMNVAGGSTPV